jgi:hypothetical protein
MSYHTGSISYNYQSFFSIVLQADAAVYYRFTCTDVGSYSKEHDSGYCARLFLFDHL